MFINNYRLYQSPVQVLFSDDSVVRLCTHEKNIDKTGAYAWLSGWAVLFGDNINSVFHFGINIS